MGTFCLEKFNQNGDLVSRKCVINPFSKSSVERDHPGFTVTEIGDSDNPVSIVLFIPLQILLHRGFPSNTSKILFIDMCMNYWKESTVLDRLGEKIQTVDALEYDIIRMILKNNPVYVERVLPEVLLHLNNVKESFQNGQ